MPYQTGDEPIRGYKLVRLLGRGGCGEVWQSAHVSGISAALKIISLDNQDADRWLPAILEIKNIRHAQVLEINRTWLRDLQGNSFGLTQARPLPGWDLIVVMELAAKSLWDRLQECQKSQALGIPRPELMDYMRDVAKGIDYLNGQGVVHGAIKPHNLLLQGSKVKVSDAGQAWLFGKESKATEAVKASSGANPSAKGPPRELHRSSDQRSLAVSYYELRTGKLPHTHAASTAEPVAASSEGRPVASDLPEREQAVFAKATHVDPTQRYPSAAAFVEALQVAQADAPSRWLSGAFHRPV
jgi:eukaryotic-like serine/threonine-protein kinase